MNLKRSLNPMFVFSITSVVAFVALTLLTNQFVEISSDVAFSVWLKDTMFYVVGYKLAYKLVASIAIGTISFVIAHMIRYSSMRTAKRKARATRLDFNNMDTHITKTA